MLKLPPFAALRAFEAVGRLGSVTRAGAELHLTHSAISHQVKALEEYLGLKLLERLGRRVQLTEDGRTYAYQVRLALLQLGYATDRITLRQQKEHLTVGLLPSFGTHWLVPRLNDFMTQYPLWHIELVAGLDVIDLEESPLDCSIRMGQASTQGVHQQRLMSDWVVMVAASDDRRFSAQQTPDEALHAGPVLVTSESWGAWFTAAGLEHQLPPQPLTANDSNLALEAARNGLGAVLTRWSIAQTWVNQGLLQRVTPVVAPHSGSYRLVWPSRSDQTYKLQVFAEWLQQQCQQFETETLQLLV